MIYLALVPVHLAIAVLIGIGILRGKLKAPKYMIVITALLPFWGALLVFVLHFHIGFSLHESKELAAEKLVLETDYYRSVTVEDKKTGKAIPIEEALLINSAREKRAIIMDVLNENPREYVEFLQKAGNNDDTEVVHYAVTAMVEISKENDYTLQKLEAAYNAHPKRLDTLTEYSDFLWDCLSQNLMQGQVEVMNRELFSQLMRQKIELCSRVGDYTRLAYNELKRKRLDDAGEVIAQMAEKWPDSEEYILLNVKYLAARGDGKGIKKFISEVNNSQIYLSTKTKEALAFWAN